MAEDHLQKFGSLLADNSGAAASSARGQTILDGCALRVTKASRAASASGAHFASSCRRTVPRVLVKAPNCMTLDRHALNGNV
jgi:hypothetical protein